LGHTPFWEVPEDLDLALERFLHDVEAGRAAHKHARNQRPEPVLTREPRKENERKTNGHRDESNH